MKFETLDFKPVIIIGAARSGTNMLRDVLTRLDGFVTWDCDEINPIWRHGNLNHPYDEFTADMARPEVIRFIRKEFQKIAKKNTEFVVEKSCANTLRLPFIHKVFPEAKYIHIYRDGRDTVASARKRWKAPFDLKYSLKKLRFVPKSDLPRIVWDFGSLRLKQAFGGAKKLRIWGVRVPMKDEVLASKNLEEICALQWDYSVRYALDFFEKYPDSVVHIRYEDFVKNPVAGLVPIMNLLEASVGEEKLKTVVGPVRTTSVGKYEKELDASTITDIDRIMRQTLERIGYEEVV